MKPLFSIITVTYNAACVIGRTLDSIARQQFGDYEYVVVDGASSDDTVSRVKASGIAQMRVISERDRGLYDAMNKGLRLADGKYVIFLNAGDAFASPDVLGRLAAKAAEGEYDILYGQTQLVDEAGRMLGGRHLAAPPLLTANSFKQGMLVCHQAFVVRRAIAPPYDLRYKYSADYEWCIRCLLRSRGNGYVGDEPIINFLVTASGTTERNRRASLCERFKIMCRYYGVLPTVWRHVMFVPRFLKERRRMQKTIGR